MIEADKRKAVYLLHQEGMSIRQIARRLRLNRKTVRRIIKEQGQMPSVVHADKLQIDEQLLRDLYQQCEGRIQRLHEILVEEYKIPVSYPTLTRRLRQLGISTPAKQRCDQVPDEPGLEMQHDTSLYTILIGGQHTRVIASLLYLRYSKRRYLKFYCTFDRFKMKCFLHEALMFWGFAPSQCIIDQYGYVAFEANYYWVPGSGRYTVKILEYGDRLKIYLQRELLAEYPLPPHGVKNQLFSPKGQPAPSHRPKNRKKPTQEEEKRLRAIGQPVNAYLHFALKDNDPDHQNPS